MAEILGLINGETVKKHKYYYRGWFGRIHEVEILATEKNRIFDGWGYFEVQYKYLIKFKNGKMKYVNSYKLMEGDD